MTFIEQIRGNRGTFSAVKLDKASLIKIKQLQEQFLKYPADINKIHCTVIFSRYKELPFYPVQKHMDITAKVSDFDIWKMENGKYCLVALLDCPELQERHKKLSTEFGVKHDYEEYRPHVTLSYNVPKTINLTPFKEILKEVRIISEYSVTKVM